MKYLCLFICRFITNSSLITQKFNDYLQKFYRGFTTNLQHSFDNPLGQDARYVPVVHICVFIS